MVDYSGNRIGDEEARKVIEALNSEVDEGVRFHCGRSYRHVLAIDREFDERFPTNGGAMISIPTWATKAAKLLGENVYVCSGTQNRR